MVESLLLSIVIIITLGIASQWTAWRFQLPAIVVMAVAGLLIGPVFGIINPKEVLGDVFSPLVSLSVAIILFEGSLSLDIRELRGLSKPVFRIVTFGAFIAWIAGSLAAHYVAGLDWAVAFIIGGLFYCDRSNGNYSVVTPSAIKTKNSCNFKMGRDYR